MAAIQEFEITYEGLAAYVAEHSSGGSDHVGLGPLEAAFPHKVFRQGPFMNSSAEGPLKRRHAVVSSQAYSVCCWKKEGFVYG
ncbi:hypothetical protein SAMN05192573_107239 [Mucilaginibacter gossypii]|uniref:Uncharacterized protein n=1 Tax=Mucilaginibacter gossypii TaxID=551996 RepID=A0A1G8ALE5_9SPHI|nr:hypothetical protein SAMN05192573_107239 [Mucilaginibacter gossypii]